PNMQSKVASLWQMQELQKKSVSEGNKGGEEADKALVNPESSIARALEQQIPELFASEDLELQADGKLLEMPIPHELQEASQIEADGADTDIAERDGPGDESLNKQALTKSEARPAVDWSSAASARAFLEQITSGKRTQTVLRFWSRHRGDIYLAIAVILVL